MTINLKETQFKKNFKIQFLNKLLCYPSMMKNKRSVWYEQVKKL